MKKLSLYLIFLLILSIFVVAETNTLTTFVGDYSAINLTGNNTLNVSLPINATITGAILSIKGYNTVNTITNGTVVQSWTPADSDITKSFDGDPVTFWGATQIGNSFERILYYNITTNKTRGIWNSTVQLCNGSESSFCNDPNYYEFQIYNNSNSQWTVLDSVNGSSYASWGYYNASITLPNDIIQEQTKQFRIYMPGTGDTLSRYVYENDFYFNSYPEDLTITVNDTVVFNNVGNVSSINESIDLNTGVIQQILTNNAGVPIYFNAGAWGQLEVYNLSINYSRALKLTIYDADTDTIITDPITVTVISDNYARNYSIPTGSINITDIPSEYFEIRYGGGNYVTQSYFTTISDYQTELELYTVKTNNSSLILFTMVDEKGTVITDATLKIQRYFLSKNSYVVVGMESIDENGQSGMYLIPYTIPYIFIVEKNNKVIFRSDPRKVFTANIQLSTPILDDVLISATTIRDYVTTDLTWNNDTKELSFFFNDPTGLVIEGCLEAYATTYLSETLIGPNCTTSNSATIVMNISSYIADNTNYRAVGYVETNTASSEYVREILTDFIKGSTLYETFSNLGLFLSYLFIITMFFIGLPNFSVSIGYTILAMITLNLAGVSFFGLPLIIGICIVGVVIAKTNNI